MTDCSTLQELVMFHNLGRIKHKTKYFRMDCYRHLIATQELFDDSIITEFNITTTTEIFKRTFE